MTMHIDSRALLVVGAALLLALAAVAAGLITISPVLWLGLILICPLMMVFMMRGMHGGHDDQEPRR